MIFLPTYFSIRKRSLIDIASALLCLACFAVQIQAQSNKAKISEYQHSFKTYGFSDPDDIPILTSNPKIYPYHKYEGYSQDGVEKEWKVVKLENDYIEVYILPEVGGKVWGAIEKSTGEEFIYRNEVMKFRNISMRGPWTSGGIEFNFGIIGHHPSTATPVDYAKSENDDGSVSCTVGNIDLPSRTQWRVEIYLAPDKAYFETRVLWYNPTHNTQSYYNWMTGAAVATSDRVRPGRKRLSFLRPNRIERRKDTARRTHRTAAVGSLLGKSLCCWSTPSSWRFVREIHR